MYTLKLLQRTVNSATVYGSSLVEWHHSPDTVIPISKPNKEHSHTENI